MAATYKKGEYVVYGANGVCYIEDVAVRRLSPDMPEDEYYILKPRISKSSTLFVPCANEVLCAKMHHCISKADIDAFLADIDNYRIAWIEDRKERSREFHAILSRGECKELIIMVRSLLKHEKDLIAAKKKLTGADNVAMQSAMKAINEELAFSLNIPTTDVRSYIDCAMCE